MISANFDDTSRNVGSNTSFARALRVGDGNGPIENKVTASSLEMVTDSMLVLEIANFEYANLRRKMRSSRRGRALGIIESKTREKVLTWIREMGVSLGYDPTTRSR